MLLRYSMPLRKLLAVYPDTNNRRCILKTGHNVELTLGPIKFTPTCASLITDDEEEDPEPAKDDLDK